MELEQDHYDVVVIGTGLAESIAAASLANSGKLVLHLDPNEYYGSAQASLTLDELQRWLSERSTQSSDLSSSRPLPTQRTDSQDATPNAGPSIASVYMHNQRTLIAPSSPFTSSSAEAAPSSNPSSSSTPFTVPPALAAQHRQYALSLYPALLPSRGSLIQTLIDSGVSKYVGFRLLDGVSVWQDDVEDGRAAGADNGDRNEREEGTGRAKGKGKATRVPGSKEDVFKDKSVSLVDKRRLMRFLMFVAGEYEQDNLYQGKDQLPIIDLLTGTFSLPPALASRIAYAVAHCSSLSEPSVSALERTRRYLKSIGRYGPSAFLVGQYGGAGEIAQGFCRACAVKGGTYVLGPQAVPSDVQLLSQSDAEPSNAVSTAPSTDRDAAVPEWRLSLPCHLRPITASHIITTPDHLSPELLHLAERRAHVGAGADADKYYSSGTAATGDMGSAQRGSSRKRTLHGIAILPDLPECLRRSGSDTEGTDSNVIDGDDTGLVLFPPPAASTAVAETGVGISEGADQTRADGRTQGAGLVRALIMGEGTGSCPAGQYIVYLSAELSSPIKPSEPSSDPSSSSSIIDAKNILQPYLNLIHPSPSYQAYYAIDTPSDISTTAHPAEHPHAGTPSRTPSSPAQVHNGLHVIRPFKGSGETTQGLDWLAEEGKRMWEEVMRRRADGSATEVMGAGGEGEAEGAEGIEGVKGADGEGVQKREEGIEGWWAGMGEQGDDEEL